MFKLVLDSSKILMQFFELDEKEQGIVNKAGAVEIPSEVTDLIAAVDAVLTSDEELWD